eukprot:762156-Hanusia_phi.AAC.2
MLLSIKPLAIFALPNPRDGDDDPGACYSRQSKPRPPVLRCDRSGDHSQATEEASLLSTASLVPSPPSDRTCNEPILAMSTKCASGSSRRLAACASEWRARRGTRGAHGVLDH